MKIVVDAKGWTLVADESTENAKRGSGVFAKTNARDAELELAQTEPSPPSDEAIAAGGLRLPVAPLLPSDLTPTEEGSKVA